MSIVHTVLHKPCSWTDDSRSSSCYFTVSWMEGEDCNQKQKEFSLLQYSYILMLFVWGFLTPASPGLGKISALGEHPMEARGASQVRSWRIKWKWIWNTCITCFKNGLEFKVNKSNSWVKTFFEFLKLQMFENSCSDLKLDGSLTIGVSAFTLNVFTDNNFTNHGCKHAILFFLLEISSYFSI